MSEEKTAPKMEENWSPDEFPTSAKPIFKAVALLVIAIIGLCSLVYYWSEHPEHDEAERRRDAVKSELLGDE